MNTDAYVRLSGIHKLSTIGIRKICIHEKINSKYKLKIFKGFNKSKVCDYTRLVVTICYLSLFVGYYCTLKTRGI